MQDGMQLNYQLNGEFGTKSHYLCLSSLPKSTMFVSYISNCVRVNAFKMLSDPQCSSVSVLLKSGFYMSERSKTIEDFTFV